MAKTVQELRNEIRQSVGRYERPVSTAFTKEALAAICEAVDYEIDDSGQLPPKSEMRAGILWSIGYLDEDDPEQCENPFRKAELQAVAEALREE